MTSLPLVLSPVFVAILVAIPAGCASTTQSMPSPTGRLTLDLGSLATPVAPGAQACRQGPVVVVVVGCQIGITAKPVGLDILDPVVAAMASDNNVPIGGSTGSLTDGSVGARTADAPRRRETPAKQANDMVGNGPQPTSAAPTTTLAPETQPAAPSGGG